MADTPLIRPLEPGDCDTMVSIIREGLRSLTGGSCGSGVDDRELDDLFAAYRAEDRRYLVVLEGEALLGGGGFAPLKGREGEGICELQRMYLSPDSRGRGLGRQLLERLLAEAVAAGYHRCYLETHRNMTAAQKLYTRFGFRRAEDRTGATGHSACDLFFVKDLSPDLHLES